MAVATRPKAPVSDRPEAVPAPSKYSEAPDSGIWKLDVEAPEARSGRNTSEAPDAGEGRAGLLENEFTHGRSQS